MDATTDVATLVMLAVVVAGTVLALFVPLALSGLVVRDTLRRRGNWGINLAPVHCPACGQPAPAMRTPKNRRQFLWGGNTCSNCGVEYDKWGRPIEGAPDPAADASSAPAEGSTDGSPTNPYRSPGPLDRSR